MDKVKWIALTVAGLLLLTAWACTNGVIAQEECKSVAPIAAEAAEAFPDVKITVYKGAEAERIVAVARTQSGRDNIDADGATVMLSDEAEGGVILLTKGECAVIAGRGPLSVIKAILDAAKVGGSI